MSLAFGTIFSVGISAKEFINARFTKRVQTFVDCVGVSVKTMAQTTLEKLM